MNAQQQQKQNVIGFVGLLLKYWPVFILISGILYLLTVAIAPAFSFGVGCIFVFFVFISIVHFGRVISKLMEDDTGYRGE